MSKASQICAKVQVCSLSTMISALTPRKIAKATSKMTRLTISIFPRRLIMLEVATMKTSALDSTNKEVSLLKDIFSRAVLEINQLKKRTWNKLSLKMSIHSAQMNSLLLIVPLILFLVSQLSKTFKSLVADNSSTFQRTLKRKNLMRLRTKTL